MTPDTKRIAVVGAGVAGLTAAWLLRKKHAVDLFDGNPYAGGHTRTLVVPDGPDVGTPVDTGFMVMNHRNYPLFSRLLRELDVALGDSDMSFGYSCERTGYAYAGTNLSALFAQRRNILSRDHWQMVRDILRFNRQATSDHQEGRLGHETLGEYLASRGYSRAFGEHYLLAMGSAIWSSPASGMAEFPARAFIQFFANHGLLSLNGRPQWKYVLGGSRTYVEAILRGLTGQVFLGDQVTRIVRDAGGVTVERRQAEPRRYDEVVVATHADEALALLDAPTGPENALLGAWQYQPNEVVLHTDEAVMPAVKRAWASWNFTREATQDASAPVSVSYHMNRLQRLRTSEQYFVSLNRQRPLRQERVLNRTTLTHPLYTREAMATQSKLDQLSGVNKTCFCGSYFGYGFHEDAVRSAVRVAERFGVQLREDHEFKDLPRQSQPHPA